MNIDFCFDYVSPNACLAWTQLPGLAEQAQRRLKASWPASSVRREVHEE